MLIGALLAAFVVGTMIAIQNTHINPSMPLALQITRRSFMTIGRMLMFISGGALIGAWLS